MDLPDPSLQMTEPDLVSIGDGACIDTALVSHINTRGNFELNQVWDTLYVGILHRSRGDSKISTTRLKRTESR